MPRALCPASPDKPAGTTEPLRNGPEGFSRSRSAAVGPAGPESLIADAAGEADTLPLGRDLDRPGVVLVVAPFDLGVAALHLQGRAHLGRLAEVRPLQGDHAVLTGVPAVELVGLTTAVALLALHGGALT